MKIVNVKQGSPEWLAHRRQYHNASDAPAMMGCSPYKTRSQLLAERHSGMAADVDEGTQRRFDDGHRVEALYRPRAEAIIGEELYPVTGVNGKLSASFDGLTMLGDQNYEHKALNEVLRAAFADIETIAPEHRETAAGKCLPLVYRCQMEHQHMVSGCERTLFAASKWNTQDELVEEHWCWYYSDPVLAEQVRAGWEQFEADLAVYVPPAAAAPAPTGKAPDLLPALRVEVTGAVTASNLDEFKQTALQAIRSVNRNLQTDQDFADAEKAIKWCEDVETRLEAAKQHILSQTGGIESLLRTMMEISAESKEVRLELSRVSKARKEDKKGEIVAGAQMLLDKHVAALNERLGAQSLIPRRVGGFGEAIKGKRSFALMQDAVDAALAGEKLAASALADRLEQNRKALVIDDVDYILLFADFAQQGAKEPADFSAILAQRLQQHRDAEAKRKQAEDDRIEKQRLARAAEPPAQDPPPIATLARAAIARPLAPAAPAQDDRPPINTGTVCERIGLTVDVARLRTTGVQPVVNPNARGGTWWAEADYPKILAGLIDQLQELYERATR